MLRYSVLALVVTLCVCGPVGAGTPVSQLSESDPKVAVPAGASEIMPFARRTKRVSLGYGRLITNDLVGDGKDRWRTGSVSLSRAWGYEWTGRAPARLGDLIETRFQGQIIAPATLTRANPADRPYAGVVSLGIHSHASNRGFDYSVGLALVLIGSQSRLDKFQDVVHKVFSKPRPVAGVLAAQIGNTLRPTIMGEIGRRYRFGKAFEVRPFVAARAGDEALLRVGADVLIGQVGRNELLVRETVSGQRYRVIYNSAPGLSLVAGFDMAYVASSVYLPQNRGYTLTRHRDRGRIGVHWQGRRASGFYGLTWLGREFSSQPKGQIVGSVRVKLRF